MPTSMGSISIKVDADLVTPIRFAHEAGQHIKVLIPNSGQRISARRSVCNEISVIDPEELLLHQLPYLYKSPSGAVIQRPSSWR